MNYSNSPLVPPVSPVPPPIGGPKSLNQLASEALDAAAHGTELFSSAFGSAVPWKTLKQNVKQLDQPGSEMTRQNADLLGQITTNLMNGIDAFDSSAQTVYELCGLTPSFLTRYIQLFGQSNPAVQKTQQDLLLRILDNEIKKLEKAQHEFDNSSSALKVASGQLQTLVKQLQIDYSENSPYFQARVRRLVAAQTGGLSGFFGGGPDKRKIAAELKAKLAPILEFYVNFSQTVQHVIDASARVNPEAQNIFKVLEAQKAQIEALTGAAAVPADSTEQRDAAIHSAEALIALCQKYRQEHV